jgi:hypothetical protein
MVVDGGTPADVDPLDSMHGSTARARGRMSARVAILLGVYGPSPFLSAQLESIAAQTHDDWELVISFDGESGAARSQVARFAAAHPAREIHLLDGPGAGATANYLHLLWHVPPAAQFVAFCDHDDVWLPEKLAANLACIADASGPAMTCGRTIIFAETLEPFAESPDFTQGPCFRNALLQSLGGANTMMVNRAALDLLLWARPHAEDAVAHDWWAYQVLSGMGARIVYDRTPRVLYRQHGGNLFGSNVTFGARMSRLAQMMQGRLRAWSDRSLRCLLPLRARLTAENARVLDHFAAARAAPLRKRVALMRRAGVFRQTRTEQALFWLAVILGRI